MGICRDCQQHCTIAAYKNRQEGKSPLLFTLTFCERNGFYTFLLDLLQEQYSTIGTFCNSQPQEMKTPLLSSMENGKGKAALSIAVWLLRDSCRALLLWPLSSAKSKRRETNQLLFPPFPSMRGKKRVKYSSSSESST